MDYIERLQLRHESTSHPLPCGNKRSKRTYYYYKLDAKMKAWYLEKISLIKNKYPYALKKLSC